MLIAGMIVMGLGIGGHWVAGRRQIRQRPAGAGFVLGLVVIGWLVAWLQILIVDRLYLHLGRVSRFI
jgi:hypothetical protein